MSIKKTDAGWLVDIQPGGRGGKRYRKTFDTKAEANHWQTYIVHHTTQDPEWKPPKKDLRRLSDLIRLWEKHHGKNLRGYKDNINKLNKICEELKNPLADRITNGIISEYRQKRLESGLSKSSANVDTQLLKGMFNTLKTLGYWKGQNPIENLKPLKTQEKEANYLTIPEIENLLESVKKSGSKNLLLVCKVCLATGARWSEATGLKRSQIKNNCIIFTKTKTGKNRTVPIPEDLKSELLNHKPETEEKLFGDCLTAFYRALENSNVRLPKGQATHVLRHSFASHFMMNDGNILTLQRILGHADLKMTMRYAHLSPEHLEEAKRLSPYAIITSRNKETA